MVFFPITGDGRLGGMQLLSQLGHLGGERRIRALGCRHLGLHSKVPIAIDVCVDDRGGALGRQRPIGNAYRR